jgi:hypothetical protein
MTTASCHRAARILLALAFVAGLGYAAPATQAAEGRYTFDLSRDGDFVAQTNFVQCVGASMQMMLNVIRPRNDRTAATQLSLQRLARRLSPPRPDGSERQGASIIGWTAGLNELGAGPYQLDGTDHIQTALRRAAMAMRETRKPVGLLMWHGRHAWVLVGFRATADPARTDDFRVTNAIVMDPLYPHGSVWGRSPAPGEMITVAELARQFVPRRKGHRASRWLAGYEGKYVTTLPYEIDVLDEEDVAGQAPPRVPRFGAGLPMGRFVL